MFRPSRRRRDHCELLTKHLISIHSVPIFLVLYRELPKGAKRPFDMEISTPRKSPRKSPRKEILYTPQEPPKISSKEPTEKPPELVPGVYDFVVSVASN